MARNDNLEPAETSNHDHDEGSQARGGRKRARTSYCWKYVKSYDPVRDHLRHRGKSRCTICKLWFSDRINASGWKRHLLKHGVKDPKDVRRFATESSAPSDSVGPILIQKTILNPLCQKEQEILDNAVVDFIVDSMTPYVNADKEPLAMMLSTFRPGYKVISSRTVCRRMVELYAILLPVLSAFLSDLPVRFSICIDGWTNWFKTASVEVFKRFLVLIMSWMA